MERTRHGVEQAQEFGRRVQAARKRLTPPISQEKLAESAGLHRTYIGHVERGEVNPTLWSIVRIAAALGTDPGELIAALRP